MTFSDQDLEYCGKKFANENIRWLLGMTFEQYMQCVASARERHRRLPLAARFLSAEDAAADRAILRTRSGLRLNLIRNGRFFERLRHHRRPAHNASAHFNSGDQA